MKDVTIMSKDYVPKDPMTVWMVRSPSEEDWMWVKRCALGTEGKDAKTPPTLEWKRSILKAEHSPICELQFSFELINVPYWVTVHLCRHHVGFQAYVESQRNDRQDKYDRNAARQDEPITMRCTVNAMELMHIAHKRLCNLASPETREVVTRMCRQVLGYYPEFRDLLVPDCIYKGGCHEMRGCGLYEGLDGEK